MSGSERREYQLRPGEGERLEVVGDVGRVLADGRVTGGRCLMIEFVSAPGNGPPLHRHEREDESFYVLTGHAKFQVDGKTLRASAGDFVFAPRGSTHAFVNNGTEPLRMLVIVSPSGIEVPFREVSSRSARESLSPGDLAAIFAPHGVAIVGPPLLRD